MDLSRFLSRWVGTTAVFILLLMGCQSQPTAVVERPTPSATTTPRPPTATPSVTTTATTRPTLTPTHTPTATATAPPTATTVTAATTAATATVTPTFTPTAVPPEKMINGLPMAEFIWLDTAVRTHIRAIYQQGQTQGRNPYAFSKVGDSVAMSSHYLTRFDDPRQYNLGVYAPLQPTIDHFAGSFTRYGIVSRVSLSARTLYELGWANPDLCQPDEDAVTCEIRLHQPSVILIRLGTNDQVFNLYEQNMRRLLDTLITDGIIPVLITKADRFEGEENRNNALLRSLAAEYAIPLIDFDRLADTLAERGLSGDAVHMTMSGDNDYTQEGVFTKGYPINDLAILMMLDEIRREVTAK